MPLSSISTDMLHLSSKPILFLFITYHMMCLINTYLVWVVTGEAGTASPFGAPEFIPSFKWGSRCSIALFYLFKVPAAALGEYSTLLKHLTADTRSDLEKIWSIYLWVVNQNFNDSTHGKHTAGDTPRGYMKWIHDGKGDVPSFFAILCRWVHVYFVWLQTYFYYWVNIILNVYLTIKSGTSWLWPYGNWIYNYMWNHSLSPLSCEFESLSWRGVLDTIHVCDKVRQRITTRFWLGIKY